MNNTAELQETIKARALAALRADELPTDKWTLKNRVSAAVCKINMDLLNENMKRPETPRLNKTQTEEIHRAIFKELKSANVGTGLR